MPKFTKKYFITEIPLRAGTHERAVLKKRFWAAKQQYNALLSESLKRLNKMREDADYTKAKMLYKTQGGKTEAKALFKEVKERHAFREYDLYAFCKQWNKKKYFLSIGARISQKIAKRAFQAVQEYQKGVRGKPRFKGFRGLSSIEDSSIDANLRLKDEKLHYLGLELPLLIDPYDPIHIHGLASIKKYVRLMRRKFNGRVRYFAQLVCEGTPFQKEKNILKKGVVGLDIGPQTIAIVSSEQNCAHLKIFADELNQHKAKKRSLQRKIARKLRLGNPAAFEENGWVKKAKKWYKKQGKSIKGKRLENRSKSLQKNINKLSDICRKQAAHRKSQHGKMVNQIVSIGNTIKTEKLSYKGWQKGLYGKSIGLRAPGMFVEILRRKAENAGGKVEEINTYKTKLSQACSCGKYQKKTMKVRWHKCACGIEAQRDLYSAFLACFVEKDNLIAADAQKAWAGMDIALHTAMRELKQSIRGPVPASLGLRPRL